MKFTHSKKCIIYWLSIILVCSGCVTTRTKTVEGNPEELQNQVTRKYLDKDVIIFLYNGSRKTGIFKEETRESVKIKDKESGAIYEIKYVDIRKIEIREKQIPLPIFLGTICGIIILYISMRSLGEALEGMGK
jgi:hypothetical protein